MDYRLWTIHDCRHTSHDSRLSIHINPELYLMEPGVKKYLIRIVNTLALGLLWLALNSTFGIMYDHAFIHDHLRIGNILFYIWFLVSLSAYLWWVIRVWREPIDFEE